MSARKQINLLPQEEFAASTIGRVLIWLLSSFRIIVIITELIVMLAFLSRFWFDAKIADLNDTIKQKQAIILAQADFEKQLKNIQKKTKIFLTMTGGVESPSALLKTVSTYLPNDTTVSAYSFTPKTVEINGLSPNELSIQQFLVNLEESGSFGKVSLKQTSSDQKNQSLLTFAIVLELKKGGNK